MTKFRLTKPLGPYGDADEYDIHAIKTVLNHLGYYTPPAQTGIEEMREPGLFDAINRFQRDHNIRETTHLLPHDPTVYALDRAWAGQDQTVRYTWRTVRDDKVRDDHAQREGQVFLWSQPPEGGHPGEDFNCRCWADPIDFKPKRKFGPPDCRAEQEAVDEATLKVRELTDKKDVLLTRVKALQQEKDEIFYDLVMTFGITWAVTIITTPIRELDPLSEFMRRAFGIKIQGLLQGRVDALGKRFVSIMPQLEYLETQMQIVQAEIEIAEAERDEAKSRLEECASRHIN